MHRETYNALRAAKILLQKALDDKDLGPGSDKHAPLVDKLLAAMQAIEDVTAKPPGKSRS